jgi:hypothetical protein
LGDELLRECPLAKWIVSHGNAPVIPASDIELCISMRHPYLAALADTQQLGQPYDYTEL